MTWNDFLASDAFRLPFLFDEYITEECSRNPFSLEKNGEGEPTQEECEAILKDIQAARLNTLTPYRTCVPRSSQSLLHALFFERNPYPFLRSGLMRLKKTQVAQLIENTIGYRPKTLFFEGREYKSYIKEIDKRIEEAGAVYVKENATDSGLGVSRVSRRRARYKVEKHDKDQFIDSLEELVFSSEQYAIEDEIPIARVAERTWEIRIIAPYHQFTYGKVAVAPSFHLNNYARGGSEGNARTLVEKVLEDNGIQHETERQYEIMRFLRESGKIAQQVKYLTDALQIALAKKIIVPEVLREEELYEQVITRGFSGTFFVVDITGVMKEGRLEPMIIEAQPSGGLPEQLGYAAYRSISTSLSKKFSYVQQHLF